MKPLITIDELLRAPGAIRLDARFRLQDPSAAERLFREAHLPGAQRLDMDRDLAGVKTGSNGRHPFPSREALARTFGALGVGPSSHVVVYDDTDHAGAARAWALFRWLGFRYVQVLDGGLRAWLEAGHSTESGDGKPRAPAEFPVAAPLLEIRGARELHGTRIVDVRAPERYRGETEPIDPVAGHIPGAKNLPYTKLLAENGRFHAPAELARLLPQEKSTYYCGSGITSCVAVLASASLGREAALYPGSWSEWCRLPGMPVGKGEE